MHMHAPIRSPVGGLRRSLKLLNSCLFGRNSGIQFFARKFIKSLGVCGNGSMADHGGIVTESSLRNTKSLETLAGVLKRQLSHASLQQIGNRPPAEVHVSCGNVTAPFAGLLLTEFETHIKAHGNPFGFNWEAVKNRSAINYTVGGMHANTFVLARFLL